MRTATVPALGVALAALLAAPPAAAQDAVPLKWSLKEGDTFYVRTVQDMDMAIGVLGQNQDMKQKATTVVRIRVKSAAPTATVVEMTYIDFKMDAAGFPGAGGVTDKMKGLNFTVTLDDKMEVKKLEGYDKFLDAIAGEDETQRKLMSTLIPESTFRQMVSQTFVIAPGKPVKPGDTWTRSDELAMGPLGTFVLKQTFKLDAVTDGVAKITGKADVAFKPGDGGAAGLPFKITKADLKADKFTGTYGFDTKAGRLKDATADGTISGTMTASAMGQEIEITMKIKMNSTTTVTDKNPIKD
jgi:hypothetical protein